MPFGTVFENARNWIELEESKEYTAIGVRGFGRGIIEYDAVRPSELSKLRYSKLVPGALVLSNIKAWEGAVTVAPSGLSAVASNRFLQYVPSGGNVLTEYISQYFTSEPGVKSLSGASPGSADRNRTLSIAGLESILVPIVAVDAQRAIVSHLASVSKGARAEGSAIAATSSVSRNLIEEYLNNFPSVRLGDHATVAPRNTEPASDEVVFVPMAAVDARTGTIDDGQSVERHTLATGYRRFEPGDLIFARITPSMQNGKSAIYRDSEGRTAYGSSEFHVLRPRDPDRAEWIWLVLRSWWFRSRAMRAFKGTAGQQRVPADFLRSVRIPWPDPHELTAVMRKVEQLEETQRELDDLRARRDELSAALLPAARNEIFTAMR